MYRPLSLNSFLALLTLCGLQIPGHAAESPLVSRFNDGRAIIFQAMNALGGPARVMGTTSTEVWFEGFTYLEGQSLNLGEAAKADIRGHMAIIGPATWAGFELDLELLGGIRFYYRRVVSDDISFNYSVPEQELIKMDAAEIGRAKGALATYPPFAMPHVLLAIAMDNPTSVQRVAAANGESAVSFSDKNGTQLTLVINDKTGFPARVEMLGVEPTMGDVSQIAAFHDYKAVNELMVPRRVSFETGVKLGEWSVSKIEVGKPISRDMFGPPQDIPWTTPPAPFTVEPIADGLFAVRLFSALGLSYTSLVVVNEDHVVVVEAPLSDLLSQPYLASLLPNLAPGLPVRYLIATHHHSDHMAGARAFAAAGATILTTPLGVEYLEKIRDVRSTLSANLLPSGAPLQTRTVSEPIKLDGRHKIEIHSIGATSHSDQMLLVYLPESQTLFVADLLSVPNSGVYPPAAKVTEEVLQYLKNTNWDIQTVVPGHGPATPWDQVLKGLSGK